MMQPARYVLLLYLVFPPLLLALIFLKLGYWPRRRGVTPHCRRCDYTLTGLTSDRCPECGQALSPQTIVQGERRRRPIVGMLGILLLLLAAGNTAIILVEVDWYRYKPTAWVIEDAASPASSLALSAWTELERRMQNGALSEAQHAQLTEVALAEQARPAGPIHMQLLHYLGRRAADGKLTAAQQKRFVEQGVKLSLKVREQIRQGDPVYFQVSYTGRGPQQGWWSQYRIKEVRIDGKPLKGMHFGSSGSTFGTDGTSATSTEYAELGQHTFEAVVENTIRHGAVDDPGRGNIFMSREVTVSDTFTIVDGAREKLITLTAEGASAAQLLAGIRVTDAVLPPDSNYLHVNIDCRNLPVNVAFDVVARIGDREVAVGAITLAKGRQMGFGVSTQVAELVKKAGRPKRITIILRGSDQAARRSIDIYEAWEGELVFDDVVVREKW